jgi:hypothetical protein
VCLLVYKNFGQKQLAINIAKDNLINITKISSSNFADRINQTKELLSILISLGAFDKNKATQCNKIMDQTISVFPFYSAIGAANLDGIIYCTTDNPEPGISIADRPYFQEAKNNLSFSASEYQIGRVSNEPILAFGYPIVDSKEKLTGVAFVGISLDHLKTLSDQVNLPKEFNVSLIDKNGVVLTRYPYSQGAIGIKNLNDPAVSKIISDNNKSGTFDLKDNLTHKERVYAYSRVDSQSKEGNIYTYIDAPVSFLNKEYNRTCLSDIIVTVLAICLVIIIVIFDWYFYVYKVIYKKTD